MDTEFLTIPEVAVLLRVGQKTAYTLAREGKLPAVRVGNQWRVPKRALEQWVAAGGVAESPKAPRDEDEQP